MKQTILSVFLGVFMGSVSSSAFADCALNETPTITEITAMIRTPSCQIQSVEDLLAKLPASLRSHYSLFYQSQSVQGPHSVDYLHPRAILYTPSAAKTLSADQDLFLTFNGEPDQPGYYSLEILQTNKWVQDPGKIFQFYAIDFPTREQARGLKWADIQRKINISDANPAKCTACHSIPARPIFAGYPHWDGAYGSFHLSLNPDEQTGFKAFLNSVVTTPGSRYQALDFKTPQVDKGDINFLDSILLGHGNTRLSDKLREINGFRVARLIQATADYERFKYAIAGALLNCEKYPAFFPPALRQKLEDHLDSVFELDAKYSEAKRDPYLDLFLQDSYNTFGDVRDYFRRPDQAALSPRQALLQNFMNDADQSQRMTELIIDTFYRQGSSRTGESEPKLRYVTEGRGLDISNWYVDLDQPTYREGAQGYFLSALVAEGQFPELKPLLDGEATDPQPFCANLKKQSLENGPNSN